jgi:hypothetical protein
MPRIKASRTAALSTSALVAAMLVAAPMSASAKEGDLIRRGSCTASSNWKLKLSPENGRIEVEAEIDQNRNGQKWNVTLKRDGNVFFRGTRTTQPPSGSFEVRKVSRNTPGADRIVVRAHNPRSGEVCRGVATFKR